MEYWEGVKKYKLHQLLVWLVFFAAWYLFRAADYPGQQAAIIITIIKVLVLALLVYLTNYLLIPVFLYKKKYLLFSGLYVTSILLAGIVKVYFTILVLQPYFKLPLAIFTDVKERFYDNIIPLFFLVSTGAAIKLVLDYIVSQKRIAAISQEKAETELQYLKSQVNPHFVFNTLNAIYFQIDKTNHDARETLLQFSDLLRYQLYECNAARLPIEKEMAYLEDYIHLQQKRKDENYKIILNRSARVKDFEIVPLLLLPFVENAFKHISHFADRPNTITITSDKETDRFLFSVLNTFEPGHHLAQDGAGGIGLRNVQRRLDLLYPGRFSLEISDNENIFSIQLTLVL